MEDSDLFLDESPAIQARARAKFQPKFKPKPKHGTSSSIPSKQPEIIKDETAATIPSTVIDPDSPLAEVALSNYPIDANLSFETSVEKMSMLLNSNADLGFGFECLDPLLTQSSNNDGDVRIDNEETETQFREIGDFPDVDAQDIMLELDTTIAPGKRSGKLKPKSRLRTSVVTSQPAVVDSVMHPPNAEFVPSETVFECLDPLPTQSSNNNGDVRIDNEETETQFQETGDFPDVDAQDIMSHTTIASGKRSGKFKPKSRLRTSVVTSPPAVVESVMHPPNAEFVPSQTVFEEASVPDFPTDHVPDCALVDLGSFIPTDPSTSECPVNEKTASLAVASGGMSSNIVEMNASLVSNHSRESKQSSTGDKVNEKGEARKQLIEQTNNPLIVDDLEDGTCNDDGLAVELLDSYAIDEDKDNNDGECNVEHASPKRITSKRSKKPVNEIEKPPRKRKTTNDAKRQKKGNETSDNPEKEQRKKFPHSTRRKRRFVDESLLNMPEEEIDFAKVALKDLILYADHKERLAKREAQALKVPLTDQSTQHTFDEENARDDERSIASEQDQGFMDDQFDYELPVKKGNGSLNYQTYMKKEPRARWSKLETELFYGAIRQFGPDFSLIQQLFPERSRHQIKLKFKNEERRFPFKVSEALASRATDHSYFQKVIEQLQVVSSADPESHGDISADFTREEEGVTFEFNKEAAKSKQDAAVEDHDADVAEDHNSFKSDEMDDDDEMLSSYISAF